MKQHNLKKGRILLLVAIVALIGLAGISQVSAQPPTPRIYIFPTNYPGPIAAGITKTYMVRIDTTTGKGAPQVNTEPGADTDKTYAYEIIIKYDPTVISVSADPARHPKYDWFNTFHKWYWDPDFFMWMDDGAYSNTFAGTYDNTEGIVRGWCSLVGDPTTDLIPTDDFGERSFPNAWLQAGDYYDLPYTDGITTSSLESPPGPWSGDYFVLFYFRVTTLVDIPTPPAEGGSWLTIQEARLWCKDGKTLYEADTEPGSIGQPPAVPEFPLGSVAPIALIAVVAYIWWVTKRKTQKVM